MTARKPRARTSAKVRPYFKVYTLIASAVELGAGFGVRRAFKHTDTPAHDDIIESVYQEMMNALCDVIDFDRC